jgi:hypothetical protein
LVQISFICNCIAFDDTAEIFIFFSERWFRITLFFHHYYCTQERAQLNKKFDERMQGQFPGILAILRDMAEQGHEEVDKHSNTISELVSEHKVGGLVSALQYLYRLDTPPPVDDIVFVCVLHQKRALLLTSSLMLTACLPCVRQGRGLMHLGCKQTRI